MERNDPWVEKYCPKELHEVVSPPQELVDIIESQDLSFPNLIFVGKYGIGKTTMAYVMANELHAELWKPRERTIDTVRSMDGFIRKMSGNAMKIILLDEAEKFTPTAQGKLREVMENVGDTRFILTTNHIDKIIPAIRSRCRIVVFNDIDRVGYLARLTFITNQEGQSVDETTLSKLVDLYYPDFRKGINALFIYIKTGQIPEDLDVDFNKKIVDLVVGGKVKEIRTLLYKHPMPDYDQLFADLFHHYLEQDDKTKALRVYQGMVHSHMAMNQLINFVATCLTLA